MPFESAAKPVCQPSASGKIQLPSLETLMTSALTVRTGYFSAAPGNGVSSDFR